MAILVDLPLADRQVIGVPFHRLIDDKFVPQLGAKRLLHKRIGGEGADRLVQRLRQEFDAALCALGLGQFIEVVFVGLAGIDFLADAFEPRRQRQSGRQDMD